MSTLKATTPSAARAVFTSARFSTAASMILQLLHQSAVKSRTVTLPAWRAASYNSGEYAFHTPPYVALAIEVCHWAQPMAMAAIARPIAENATRLTPDLVIRTVRQASQ